MQPPQKLSPWTDGNESEETKDVEEETKDDEKRGITYQIAKNKGLTPHRKKEQRNPRVKHRIKFRKAKIRRKGQVSSSLLLWQSMCSIEVQTVTSYLSVSLRQLENLCFVAYTFPTNMLYIRISLLWVNFCAIGART